VAASLGKRLFWRDTGEPVKLDLFFKHFMEVLFDIQPEPLAERGGGRRGGGVADCFWPDR
jgi:hypothetical protein